jgi:ubiquinone/menaquinone biosynthesis C-methylase UbiE
MDTVASDNSEQVEYWNGDVGRKWARNQDRLDRAFRPLTAALMERVEPRPGERAIDIGCGCGELSLALARSLGAEGRVLAVDVSRPMLEHARSRPGAREAGQAMIEWQEADAAAASFAPGGFDLLVSRFGVMFFADPVGAFQNLRRALRPGGRLVMLCWRPLQDNPWVAVPRAAMLQVLPAPAPMAPDAPGPFAFADAARVGAILARAGFSEVASVAVDAALGVAEGADEAALEAAVQFVIEVGPASALLRDVDEDGRGRAVEAVREALRSRAREGRPSLDAACWIYTAVNPTALSVATV